MKNLFKKSFHNNTRFLFKEVPEKSVPVADNLKGWVRNQLSGLENVIKNGLTKKEIVPILENFENTKFKKKPVSPRNSARAIVAIQAGLKHLGLFKNKKIDGIYGIRDTKPAILAFQKQWNKDHPKDRILIDGDPGPQTIACLIKSLTAETVISKQPIAGTSLLKTPAKKELSMETDKAKEEQMIQASLFKCIKYCPFLSVINIRKKYPISIENGEIKFSMGEKDNPVLVGEDDFIKLQAGVKIDKLLEIDSPFARKELIVLNRTLAKVTNDPRFFNNVVDMVTEMYQKNDPNAPDFSEFGENLKTLETFNLKAKIPAIYDTLIHFYFQKFKSNQTKNDKQKVLEYIQEIKKAPSVSTDEDKIIKYDQILEDIKKIKKTKPKKKKRFWKRKESTR